MPALPGWSTSEAKTSSTARSLPARPGPAGKARVPRPRAARDAPAADLASPTTSGVVAGPLAWFQAAAPGTADARAFPPDPFPSSDPTDPQAQRPRADLTVLPVWESLLHRHFAAERARLALDALFPEASSPTVQPISTPVAEPELERATGWVRRVEGDQVEVVVERACGEEIWTLDVAAFEDAGIEPDGFILLRAVAGPSGTPRLVLAPDPERTRAVYGPERVDKGWAALPDADRELSDILAADD